MEQPKLSILIASIPSRWEMTQKLYGRILNMIGDKEIELLLFVDNKKRSIGEKREALKNMANGKYFFFVDSDDDLTSIDELYEAAEKDVDVITYNVLCDNEDGSTYIVKQGLNNEVEHNTKDGRYLDCKRPAWFMSAWNSKFKQFSFPPISYSEDWEWIKQCLTEAKTEHHIDKILYKYQFNPQITEANTESNEYWTNPN